MSYPSSLFSPLINAAPKRRFYSLLLYLLYLQIFFQKTSFALYSSRVLSIPSLSFSTSLSSFFHSFNNTPSFPLSRSFPISLSSFPSLISSISTSFSLFFFSTSPTSLYFLYSIYNAIPSFLFSSLINTAPIPALLLLFLYLLFFLKKILWLFTLPVYYLFYLYPSPSLSPPFSTLSIILLLFSYLSPSLLYYPLSLLLSPSYLLLSPDPFFSTSLPTSPTSLYSLYISLVISFLLIFLAN